VVGGFEFWLIAVVALLIIGPVVIAGVIFLVTRKRGRNEAPPPVIPPRPQPAVATGPEPIASPSPEQPLAIPPALELPYKPPFWTRRRIVFASVLAAILIVVPCAVIGVVAWRGISAETTKMAEMRELVDEAYPDYSVVDSTRFGYILQHDEYESLRIDVRFFEEESVWPVVPRERASDKWYTHDTFFRHAEGMPADPKHQLNYDIEGFADAYESVRPGPDSVISAVWLEDDPWDGVEKYVVLVARRNRTGSVTEPMWPDHIAYFTRDCTSGEWTAYDFGSIDDEAAWYPPYLADVYGDDYAYDEGDYGDPYEALAIAEEFLETIVLDADPARAFEMTDPETWEGGTAAEFEQAVTSSPGYGEAAGFEVQGYFDSWKNPVLADSDFEIFFTGTAGDRTIFYRVTMRKSEQGAYQPAALAIKDKLFAPRPNMLLF